jgi:hypothetical protein
MPEISYCFDFQNASDQTPVAASNSRTAASCISEPTRPTLTCRSNFDHRYYGVRSRPCQDANGTNSDDTCSRSEARNIECGM